MSARRVLVVAPSFHPAVRYGGPTYASWNLVRALGARGVEVRVLTTNAHRDDVIDVPLEREHELAPGVRVTYLPRVSGLGESVAPALSRRLWELAPWADVVHLGAVYNATTFPTLLAVRRANKPLVWTTYGAHYYALRDPDVRRPHLKRAWDVAARALLDRARTILVCASEMEAEASRERMPGVRVEVIREPVTLPAAPSRRAASGVLRVLSLGRLDPIKAIERVLDALRDHDAQLTIAGAGEAAYVASLEAHARPLGGRVRFVGHADEAQKAALFASHDVLALTSRRESYGIVVGEALAHGVPALVVRPTAWEMLEAVGAGVVAEPQTLAARLRDLDPASASRMGWQARRYAERELSVEVAAERMIGLHDALLGRRRAWRGSR